LDYFFIFLKFTLFKMNFALFDYITEHLLEHLLRHICACMITHAVMHPEMQFADDAMPSKQKKALQDFF